MNQTRTEGPHPSRPSGRLRGEPIRLTVAGVLKRGLRPDAARLAGRLGVSYGPRAQRHGKGQGNG